jgi:hypothetical protein
MVQVNAQTTRGVACAAAIAGMPSNSNPNSGPGADLRYVQPTPRHDWLRYAG